MKTKFVALPNVNLHYKDLKKEKVSHENIDSLNLHSVFYRSWVTLKYWEVYYTSPEGFIITFSYLLGTFIEF